MKQLPREKLATHGPDALEDHELVSLIVGRGTRREDVFSLAQRLLKGFDREELILEQDMQQFQEKFRIRPVAAAQLMASIELGKRLFKARATPRQLQTSKDVHEIVKNMQYLKKEYVRGLYVNTRNRIIHDEIISIGSLDANILHPREVFRPAIEYGAYAVILAHNHPSGDARPSPSDITTTKTLVETAELLQIPLLDHLIVGENQYFSFSSEKLI